MSLYNIALIYIYVRFILYVCMYIYNCMSRISIKNLLSGFIPYMKEFFMVQIFPSLSDTLTPALRSRKEKEICMYM